MDTFGSRLKIAIEVNGMRPMDFVQKTSLSATHVSHFMNGDREPSLSNLAIIIKALPGVDARWLVCGGKS